LPKLENRRLVISSRRCSSEKDALDHLLGAMRDLRQGELGRKQSPEQGENRHPGRSYWPEADAIRECTNSSRRSRHSEPVTTTRAFPRAAFGLPIIFHFLAGSSDPIDTTLNPANRGRLASRLILRPHRAQSGAVEAMALVIEHRPAEAIVLSGGGMSKPKEVRASVTNDEAMSMAVGRRPRPLVKDGKPFADPIDRYLEEIR
jgi:CRISPR-associated protein Cmr1